MGDTLVVQAGRNAAYEDADKGQRKNYDGGRTLTSEALGEQHI